MLITKTVITKWNSKTKRYYESLGYVYTGKGTDLEVRVEDLPDGSVIDVEIMCDYCGCSFYRRWNHYIRTHDTVNTDSCYECSYLKTLDVNRAKYGVENPMHVDDFKESQKNTMLEKYGVENGFMSEEIKQRSRETCLNRYGVSSFTQTDEYIAKTKQTSMERYAHESYMQSDEARKNFTGENHPRWKGGIHDERWNRLQPKYKQWRFSVFSRDHFLCQGCGIHSDNLEAHHIYNWNEHIDIRYDVDNGITFCHDCHAEFHRTYGKRNNTFEQLEEFLKR